MELLDLINPSFEKAVGTVTAGGQDFWDAQMGFFGRLNYAYDNKYLLEANIRRDGTSVFPDHLKWRTFPSASIGWVVSEESFMKELDPVVSFWRFRGSWGSIGDQTVRNDLYVPTLTFVNNSGWLTGSAMNPMFRTPAMVHPDISWQSLETLNFGIDARFFNAKLGVSYDLYRRDTRDMISTGPTMPHTAGAPTPQGNFSTLRTTGWELAIDYSHRFKNGLVLNGLFTMSDAQTHIHDFDESAFKGFAAWNYWEGKRMGDIWGYKTDGLYQRDDFVWENGNLVRIFVPFDPNIAPFFPAAGETPTGGVWMHQLAGNNPAYAPRLQTGNLFMFGPGDVKYRDLTGDGRVDNGAGNADDPGDMVVIGNSNPRFMYGLRLGAEYRGFDFSMFWQGIGSRQVWGDGSLAIPGYNTADGSMPQAIAGNFWREDRTDAFYPRPFQLAATAGGATNFANTHPTDRYLLDMSYLRLKNLTLGYTLPQNVLQQAHLSRARVYVALENFLTFDNLRGLPIDPEAVGGFFWSGESAISYNSGRIGAGAPVFKNVSVGLQITL